MNRWREFWETWVIPRAGRAVLESRGRQRRVNGERWMEFQRALLSYVAPDGAPLYLLAAPYFSQSARRAYVAAFMIWCVRYLMLAATTAGTYANYVCSVHGERGAGHIPMTCFTLKRALRACKNLSPGGRKSRLPISPALLHRMVASCVPPGAAQTLGYHNADFWFPAAALFGFHIFGRISEYIAENRTMPERQRVAGRYRPEVRDLFFVWEGQGGDLLRIRADDGDALLTASGVPRPPPSMMTYNLRQQKCRDRGAEPVTIRAIERPLYAFTIPCPVVAMWRYMTLRHMAPLRRAPLGGDQWKVVEEHDALFVRAEGGGSKAVSQKDFRTELQLKLTSLGIEWRQNVVDAAGNEVLDRHGVPKWKHIYTAHSMRHGAASAAYANGVSIDVIKKMGRWRSDCVLRYLHESTRALDGARAALAMADVRATQGWFTHDYRQGGVVAN